MVSVKDNKIIMPIHRPSLREYLFFFISGIIMSVPFTLFIGRFTESLCVILPIFYATICSVSIFAPFVEEIAKAYPLIYRHGETERSIFTLGFLIGLGFGVSEFLLYVFTLGAPIHIRLLGIFFHAASTSITAYGIAKKRTIYFYLIAVFLHFLNNFSALFGSFWIIGGVFAIMMTYFLSWRLFGKTSEKIVN